MSNGIESLVAPREREGEREREIGINSLFILIINNIPSRCISFVLLLRIDNQLPRNVSGI